MRVFMTGATGFVGRATLLRLQRDGHQVVAWVRSLERARSLLGADVELIAASHDDERLRVALQSCEAVVNLAGEPLIGKRWTKQRRAALVESRVGLSRRIVAAIERCVPRATRVMVSASAVGYYGDRGDEVLSEQSDPARDFAAQLCVDWESAALRAREFGVRVACLRLGIVLGRGGGALATMQLPFELGLGGPIGAGDQYMAWVHLHDVAAMIAQALHDDRMASSINAVAVEPVRNRAFSAALARALHRPNLLRVPRVALKLLFGHAASAMLASQRVLPSALDQIGFRHAFPTLELALADLVDASEIAIDPIDARSPAPTRRAGYLAARRPRYLLRSSVTLSVPREQLFAFFSRAENLGLMTPAKLAFDIRRMPSAMGTGASIEYRLRVAGVPLRWRTRIEHWDPEHCFVDSQERGPYRAWWHEHRFAPQGDRTLMEDRVYYAPPFGWLGRVANRLFVSPMLRAIFGFRGDAIRLRFGVAEAPPKRC
jgi:uncharacterized protein